jgi:hypothetical protein
MGENAWLALLTGFSATGVALLGIMLASLRAWKKELREHVKEMCRQNEEAHRDLWDRVNYHRHNGGGNVVIPQKG